MGPCPCDGLRRARRMTIEAHNVVPLATTTMVNDPDRKVLLATGGTEGIGKAAVRGLPKRDAAGVWRYDPADVIRAAAARGTPNRYTAG